MSQSELANDAGDADLLTRVGIALTLRLQHVLQAVHITVDQRTVTLRGILPTFYDRQLAIELTRRVAGVLRVNDELTVLPDAGVASAPGTQRVATTSALRGAGTESTTHTPTSSSLHKLHHKRTWQRALTRAASVPRSLFLMIGIVLAIGCSDGAQDSLVAVHPATGTITFRGQPIPGAMITLHPKAELAEVPKPRASVGKDGEFALTTFSGKDGAPEGEYTITVVWYRPIKLGADVQAGPNVIPKKFTMPQTSNLTVTIAAGENRLPAIHL